MRSGCPLCASSAGWVLAFLVADLDAGIAIRQLDVRFTPNSGH
jgi:hypothetical protein